MKRSVGIAGKGFRALLALFVSAWGVQSHAGEQKGPKFEEATYYSGGAFSNWGAGYPGWQGLGFSTTAKHLYIAGGENTSGGNRQTLVLKLSIPPGPTPTGVFRWPNDQNIQQSALLPGMAATDEGLFLVGQGKSSTVSRYGVWGNTGILVKYPLDGPTGPEAGRALWVSKPSFFPAFNGNEALFDVIAVTEGGSTFLYAAGEAEATDDNVTAVVAKFDAKGTMLWRTALVEPVSRSISHGFRLTAVNGQIYVAGSLNPNTLYDAGNWRAHIKPVLWKVDPSGNVIWMKTYPKSIADVRTSAVAGSEGSIVLVTTLLPGSDKNSDVLLLKYGPSGNLLWSKEWGTLKEDVSHAAIASGNRLYVVGETRGWVGGELDVFLLEVELSTGNVLSAQYYGGKMNDRAFRVLVAGTDIYVLGDSNSHSSVMGQPELMLLRYSLTQALPPLSLKIDIRPGSTLNPVNLKSKGKIPVAILSTPEFDAPAQVDRASVTFGRTGEEKSLVSPGCRAEDVNGDGRLDLMCHFDTPRCGFQVGDTRGILMAKTLSGRACLGVDSIVIVPKEKEEEKEGEKEKPELRRQPKKEEPHRIILPDTDSKRVKPSFGGGIHGPDKKDGSIVY